MSNPGQITGTTGPHAASQAKPPRPPKADAFKQAMARAMEGAGPDATPARPARAHARASGLVTQAAHAALAQPAARPAADGGFRARIALAESSARAGHEGYGARNPSSGALGRYQFLPVALQDLGWQDATGRWSALAAQHGVRSEAEFLANPAAQEAAMSAYLARTEVQLDRNGSLARAGASITGLDGGPLRLTESGLVAAAHRRGAGSVARYLAHRTETPEMPLSPAQRQAFAAVERRLRDFAEVNYTLASRTGAATRPA